MPTPEHWICRVCRTSLDVYSYKDGTPTGYRHAAPVIRKFGSAITDHEPDPVSGLGVMDIIGVCDFCGSPRPRYHYPCATFEVEAVPATLSMGMVQEWAACGVCKILIDHDRWEALAQRSIACYPTTLLPEVQQGIRLLHQQFRRHKSGPAVDHLAPRG